GWYAYHRLGWRNAVTVYEDDPAGWARGAGFVAEFCSLGGRIGQPRLRTGTLTTNFAPVVKRIPLQGGDGAAFPSGLQPADHFMKALAKRYPRLGGRLLVNADPEGDSALSGRLRERMLGVVGASTLPWAHTAASRRFATASNLHFGDPNEADVYTY